MICWRFIKRPSLRCIGATPKPILAVKPTHTSFKHMQHFHTPPGGDSPNNFFVCSPLIGPLLGLILLRAEQRRKYHLFAIRAEHSGDLRLCLVELHAVDALKELLQMRLDNCRVLCLHLGIVD